MNQPISFTVLGFFFLNTRTCGVVYNTCDTGNPKLRAVQK